MKINQKIVLNRFERKNSSHLSKSLAKLKKNIQILNTKRKIIFEILEKWSILMDAKPYNELFKISSRNSILLVMCVYTVPL